MTGERVRDLTQEASPTEESLLSALKAAVQALTYAYVFDWIPEQGVTIYSVVVPDKRVAIAELAETGEVDITLFSLKDYTRLNPKLSAEKRRKLAAAESLI